MKVQKKSRLDAPETTVFHGELIKKKNFLKRIYEEWYGGFIEEVNRIKADGKILELGSGGGFLKEMLPEVITSDVLELPECDLQCYAEDLPFGDHDLKAIFMLDVLHHIPESRKFFHESSRTLKPGGIIYMIEPANTFFSRIIYKNFHHEVFDERVKEWNFKSIGPLTSSNQALPWIIFSRDREIFEKEFPDLKIQKIYLHTPFRYLLSGGLSYNIPIPGWSFKFFTNIEKLMKPLFGYFSMFQTIIVEKVS